MKKFKQNPKLIDIVSETIDIARWGRQDGERLKLGRKAGNKSNDGKKLENGKGRETERSVRDGKRGCFCMVSKNVLPLPGKCRNMFFGLKTRQKGRQGTRHDDNWKNKWKKLEGKRLLAHAGKVRRKTDQGNRA